ncbi:hypothetical protein L1887_40423 [Cichorium endivia]|nr:hypothetical protein L1887_40423 [Cichorium endivia]
MQEMETVIEDKDEKTQVLESLLGYILCTTQSSLTDLLEVEIVRSYCGRMHPRGRTPICSYKKPQLICYDGFEPSDRMHIAQVLSRLWVRSEKGEQTASQIIY